jgi:hypothetical protein
LAKKGAKIIQKEYIAAEMRGEKFFNFDLTILDWFLDG